MAGSDEIDLKIKSEFREEERKQDNNRKRIPLELGEVSSRRERERRLIREGRTELEDLTKGARKRFVGSSAVKKFGYGWLWLVGFLSDKRSGYG